MRSSGICETWDRPPGLSLGEVAAELLRPKRSTVPRTQAQAGDAGGFGAYQVRECQTPEPGVNIQFIEERFQFRACFHVPYFEWAAGPGGWREPRLIRPIGGPADQQSAVHPPR